MKQVDAEELIIALLSMCNLIKQAIWFEWTVVAAAASDAVDAATLFVSMVLAKLLWKKNNKSQLLWKQ